MPGVGRPAVDHQADPVLHDKCAADVKHVKRSGGLSNHCAGKVFSKDRVAEHSHRADARDHRPYQVGGSRDVENEHKLRRNEQARRDTENDALS